MAHVLVLIAALCSNNSSMTTLHFVGSLTQNLKPFLKKYFKNTNLALCLTRIQTELSLLFEINEPMKMNKWNLKKNKSAFF